MPTPHYPLRNPHPQLAIGLDMAQHVVRKDLSYTDKLCSSSLLALYVEVGRAIGDGKSREVLLVRLGFRCMEIKSREKEGRTFSFRSWTKKGYPLLQGNTSKH